MTRGSATAAKNRASLAQGPPSSNFKVPTATLHVAIVGPTTYADSARDGGSSSDHDDDGAESLAHLYPVSTPAPRATFPVKLDVRITLEGLREMGLQLYASHCTDSGVTFDPPSHLPGDYDIFYATPEGAVAPERPLLVSEALGGGTLRVQVINSGPRPPLHMLMVPGRLWTQRHRLEREEAVRRRALHAHCEAVQQRCRVLAGVASKRAQQAAKNRQRHMSLVEEIEGALFGALAAANTAALQMQRVANRLAEAERQWEVTLGRRAADAAALEAEKRRFFAGSCNAAQVANRAASATV